MNNILKASCNDCHSSNTEYHWYFKVQPVAWILADHIKTGKKLLNFSDFGSYCIAKQYMQFENIIEDVKTEDMPLNYYVLIHRHAVLNEENKALLISWSQGIMAELKAKYPCDVFDKKINQE